jgi:chromosome segregation ATPase
MARAKSGANGRLEEAMASLARSQENLLQNQASFVNQIAETNRRIDEAMANLARSQENWLQNQALFVAQMAETSRRIDESNHRIDERFGRIDERFGRIDERFGRIEAILLQHGQILNELIRMLERLPEAVREKIGLEPPEQSRRTE